MRWDCHEHRDELRVSIYGAVYHLEHGVLCYGECHWDVILYYPVLFKDARAAQQWIEKGCIAEIQESFHNLLVGFRKMMIEVRE